MSPALAYKLRRLRRIFAGLPRRAYLTYRHHGPSEFLKRCLTFPLRLTPLGPRYGLTPGMSDPTVPARRWWREHGRPVAVVIPTYGDPAIVARAVRSVRGTTDNARVRTIVTDDGSAAQHQAELRRLAQRHGFELVLGDRQAGFAANCNRGIARARPDEDVVLINSDVVAHAGWLEVLQYTASTNSAGITGAQLLYPDSSIQFGGMVRNPYEPKWFDHRHRGRRADLPEAAVTQPILAVTGACMYITRAVLDDVGQLDEGYEMAFEDVDYCLRAWNRGHRVLYAPAAVLTHHEGKTRGLAQGARELRSQSRFWDRWGDWFDARDVSAPDGGVRIVYVTQDTGIGGGHRVIFNHLNGLAERGHEVELWTLADGGPDWFDLRVPVRCFSSYPELCRALTPLDAIKVATWWETADWVWEASVCHGVGVYWVQDIETSYYPDDPRERARVMASYRPDFRYFAGSEWIADQLGSIVTDVTVFTPGLDDRFHPLPGVQRRDDVIVALGRSQPLKDFPLTRATYLALPEPRPELWLFGGEPELAAGLGDRVRYIERPSDQEVNRLLNEATVLLQTSLHEGFCLPVLEAMAAGAVAVCTDAHGNRDFCRHEENCLMPSGRSAAMLARAIRRLLDDPALRRRLATGGFETARDYAWAHRLDRLHELYCSIAADAASGSRAGVPHSA